MTLRAGLLRGGLTSLRHVYMSFKDDKLGIVSGFFDLHKDVFMSYVAGLESFLPFVVLTL